MASFVIGACALSGLILLDKWQVAEVGVSQPIVACPLVGMVYGQFEAGLFLGAALQTVWVAQLPLGSERPLDYQAAGVVAALSYALMRRLSPGANDGGLLLCSLVLAGVASYAAELLDAANRRVNALLYDAGVRASRASGVLAWHLLGLGTGFARGVLVAAVFLALAALMAQIVPLLPAISRDELLALALGIGAAAIARMFVTVKRLPWAAAGCAASGILWLLSK